MSLITNLFKKRKNINLKEDKNMNSNAYKEIGNIIKDSRINKNMSIEYLSKVSKLPQSTITSIEENIENKRPQYPFIRSILLKLEECLDLEKYTLVKIIKNENRTNKRKSNINYLVNKLDLLNSMEGNIIYIFILVISIFIINNYYLNSRTVEFEIIKYENKKN